MSKLVEIEQHQADLGQCSGCADRLRAAGGQTKIAVGGHGFFESIGLPGFSAAITVRVVERVGDGVNPE